MSRKLSFTRFLSLAFCLLAIPWTKVEAQSAIVPVSDSGGGTEFRNGLEQDAFYLVNQYRKANKLPPFHWDNAITKVARDHSRDMASGDVDFGHDGFQKRVTILKTTGFRGAGENVLKTDDPDDVAKKAVALWLRSPHHLANIRGDYNYSGLGVWRNKDGYIYFTQIFMKIEPPAQEAQVIPVAQPVPFGLLADPVTRKSP